MGSTLDPDNPPPEPSDEGRDTGALGPSDTSDSGSDIAGAKRHEFDRDTELDEHALDIGESELSSDTDSTGTGERSSAEGDSTLTEDADIRPDRIETPYGANEESERQYEGEREGKMPPDLKES
jgi:hypothetical protein